MGKKLELRGSYEHSRHRGFYPYDSLGVDDSNSVRFGTEARFNWDVRPNQRFTVGGEISRNSPANYNYVVGDYRLHLLRP